MSKQDQAERIAAEFNETWQLNLSHSLPDLACRIRRAITAAVRKERERCVGIVDSDDKLYPSDQIRLAAAIRKGKA